MFRITYFLKGDASPKVIESETTDPVNEIIKKPGFESVKVETIEVYRDYFLTLGKANGPEEKKLIEWRGERFPELFEAFVDDLKKKGYL